MFHTVARNADAGLVALLRHLECVPQVDSRAGRTREQTHVALTLDYPLERELLVYGRKPNLAAQIAETAWVLAGRNDVEWLSHYLPRAKDFSDDGNTWRAGYGPRIRSWGRPVTRQATTGPVVSVDQLAYVVHKLTEDPNTRQAVISIWDPRVDTQPGKDVPCNDWLCFTLREGRLSLHVATRSNDVIWGWSGINQFEWSVLLEVVAWLVGAEVGELHFAVASMHIYERHWVKSKAILDAWEPNQVTPRSLAVMESPRFRLTGTKGAGLVGLQTLDEKLRMFFDLEDIIRTMGADAVDVRQMSEPMLASWLLVLQWYWSGGDESYLKPLKGSPLHAAAVTYSTKPKSAPVLHLEDGVLKGGTGQLSDFVLRVTALHNEKAAAYGDSWKRRGEMLGIMANIARKVDRLGGSETADETSADTAADLFVYLAKYRAWLAEHGAPLPIQTGSVWPRDQLTGGPAYANAIMMDLDLLFRDDKGSRSRDTLENYLRTQFDQLEKDVTGHNVDRWQRVDAMLRAAYRLARLLDDQANVEPGDEYRGAVDPSEAR